PLVHVAALAGSALTGAPIGRDDPPTVAAIGVLAMCIVTADHEAIGHGTACFLAGGRATLLTSVYFHCDVGSAWVAIAGPIGNLAGAAAAWLIARGLPPHAAHAQLLLMLITAFAL